MESNFSRALVEKVTEGKTKVVEILAALVVAEQMNAEVLSEALRCLGHMEDNETYALRRWTLEQGLYSSSPRIRDGAALGLSFLDDPHAIPYLKEAVERESIQMLREDLKQILELVENSHF